MHKQFQQRKPKHFPQKNFCTVLELKLISSIHESVQLTVTNFHLFERKNFGKVQSLIKYYFLIKAMINCEIRG